MKMDLIGEILARFADQVPDLEWQEMVRDWEEEPAFVELARQIKEVLALREPAVAFRQRLERELLTPLRTPARAEALSPAGHSLVSRKKVLLGAAAVGTVASAISVLGVAILMARRRFTARPASHGSSGMTP